MNLRVSIKKYVKLLIPPSLILYRVAPTNGKIALTFDDGPNPDYTAGISSILRANGARATFFVIGNYARSFPQLIEQLIADGHEIANHSASHPEFSGLGYRALAQEIEPPYQLTDTAGRPVLRTRFFRPPRGVINLRILAYCWWHRHRLVLWSSDPEDFKAPSPQQILNHFERHPPRAGDIVLLHDKTGHTAAALPSLLKNLRERRLAAVTLSELVSI